MLKAQAARNRSDATSGWRLGLCSLLLALFCGAALAGSEPYLYGPIRAGEQLVRIAEALRPDPTPESTWQTMAALYRANPRAFLNGDIHRLRPGAMLVVPVDAEVRAVNVEQARQLALAPRKPNPALQAQGTGRLELSEQLQTPAATASARPTAGPKPASSTRPGRAVAQKPARKPKPTVPAPADPPVAAVDASVVEPEPAPRNEQRAAPALALRDVVPLPVPSRWRLADSLNAGQPASQTPPTRPLPLGKAPLQGTLQLLADSELSLRRAPLRANSTQVALQNRSQLALGAQLVADVHLQAAAPEGAQMQYRIAPVVHLSHRNPSRDDGGAFASDQDFFLGLQSFYADGAPAIWGRRARVRFGIQPVLADPRGMIVADEPLGVSVYGTADRLGRYQLGWLRRWEKDPESGLNALHEGLREDDVLLLQLEAAQGMRPAWPLHLLLAHHRNREGNDRFGRDGQLERPSPLGLQRGRNFDVTYLGASAVGNLHGAELYVAGYLAVGEEDRGSFVDRSRDVVAGMAATEARWQRGAQAWRLSALWASGDGDPTDGSANGFDAIAANPRFAGAEDSGWARAALDLPGRDVELHGDYSWLPALRSSQAHGQSNFANPGLILLGLGGEHWPRRHLRFAGALNHLWFSDSRSVELASGARNIPSDIGWDFSLSLLWRPQPALTLKVTGTALLPGDGHQALFAGEDDLHGVFVSAVTRF